jgi:hypothetical protein
MTTVQGFVYILENTGEKEHMKAHGSLCGRAYGVPCWAGEMKVLRPSIDKV